MVSGWIFAAVLAVSARYGFEEAYANVDGGAWYIGHDNETATLAWGESYVMSGLAAMARATHHPMYLDRLAEHIDAVLAQRDDARGVADYRGVSGACWRNMSYQPEPYCYAVHTGMLITPMLEFVAQVEGSPWAQQPSYDGETLADKAARYLVAVQESAAFHEFEWNEAGYYEFPADLPSLPAPGQAQPLNQSNALGRAHVLLAALTGDPGHYAKATALAQRFRDQITTGAQGEYLWNYGGGAYASFGEDISHAAINVDFAVLAAAHGIVFDDTDLEAFATTFVERIYVDDATFADRVGGGTTNGASYRPQIGRWVGLAPQRPTVYAAVRDAYDRDYPPAAIGSGSMLLAWGLLAEHEPKLCAPFFYVADWDDQGDVREATAYGANIQAVPHDLSAPCLVPLEHDAPRPTVVSQWDGDAYHPVASFTASAAMGIKHVPYDPAWPFVYADDGVLFQLEDAFVEGDGILVAEPATLEPPTIESSPPAQVELGVAVDYTPVGSGDAPYWWSLVDGPGLARIDPFTGTIAWTPTEPGAYAFVVRLDNRVGADEQAFEVIVEQAGDTGLDASGDDTTSSGGGEGSDGGEGSSGVSSTGTDGRPGGADTTGDPAGEGGATGCGCRTEDRGRAGLLVVVVVAPCIRRRRSLHPISPAQRASGPEKTAHDRSAEPVTTATPSCPSRRAISIRA